MKIIDFAIFLSNSARNTSNSFVELNLGYSLIKHFSHFFLALFRVFDWCYITTQLFEVNVIKIQILLKDIVHE